MSDKKITLKVTVKPNGDNGWRTVCNAYPQIVGEGRDCEAALSSLVEKIREEFKEGTFKLDSQLIPAVSCQITEMKANLVLGTENYTLADFGTEAEADAEAEGEPEETAPDQEAEEERNCKTCFGLIQEEEAADKEGFIPKIPCESCDDYGSKCTGSHFDKAVCSAYPRCIDCKNCISLRYEEKEEIKDENKCFYRYHWRVNCKELGSNIPTMRSSYAQCGNYEENVDSSDSVIFDTLAKGSKEADAAQTAEEAA